MADVKTTPMLTPAQQIRLESVSLAYRHDRSPEDIVKRAEELAKFVEGKQAAAKPGKPGKVVNDEQVAPEGDLI